MLLMKKNVPPPTANVAKGQIQFDPPFFGPDAAESAKSRWWGRGRPRERILTAVGSMLGEIYLIRFRLPVKISKSVYGIIGIRYVPIFNIT